MMSPQEISARDLYRLIEKLLVEQCGCVAHISLKTCIDVIEHHESDLGRLLKIHPLGVHPSKHIGYLVFWIRKLKPISVAYALSDLEPYQHDPDHDVSHDKELNTINEVVSIYVAQHLMLSYAEDNLIIGGIEESEKAEFVRKIQRVLENVLTLTVDVGHGHGNLFKSFLYDMRYRTFGPHHVVHFVNHVVYAARGSLKGEGKS
ncbi:MULTISPECIES: hypothetical protein [Methylobacterium]|uniref:hypothetical protein n=1 Tax=Methylobacterium TaxID=407 RepID=UPI0013EB6C67|nr:hypothetical protein [Methylobacterium sp. DB0501]NGM32526.1 hypothetical protein [Methylobacterium sp. DB0501]